MSDKLLSTNTPSSQTDSNTSAISDLQTRLIKQNNSGFEKAIKIGQVIAPLVVVWFAYYVNAELRPVIKDVAINRALLTEEKRERKELESKIHAMDVKKARDDQILKDIREDIKELKDLIKKQSHIK